MMRKFFPPRVCGACGSGFCGAVSRTSFSATVNLATIRVLTANGVEVVMPRMQTCCGALHAHNGLRDTTRECARRNIDAFLGAGVDFIITNAAGCGATMKEYNQLLAGDLRYAERAQAFVAIVRDVSEFLASWEMKPFTHPVQAKIAYHDACHLAHGQGIRAEPRNVLRNIPGVTLAELNDGEMCCGSAGIYNLVHPVIAGALQERKMDAILQTGAQTVAAANPGCLIQILSGAKRIGLPLRVAHPVELMAQAYGFDDG